MTLQELKNLREEIDEEGLEISPRYCKVLDWAIGEIENVSPKSQDVSDSAVAAAFAEWYGVDIQHGKYEQEDHELDIFTAGWKAARELQQAQVVGETMLPVEIFGTVYNVPIGVQLHIVQLRDKLNAIRNTRRDHPVIELLWATEHCLSAAEEGVDYSVSRPMLDAMTTLGLMEKVGRGKWAPTDAASEFVRIANSFDATPQSSAPVVGEVWRSKIEMAMLHEGVPKHVAASVMEILAND